LFQRKFDIKLMVMENLEQREIGRSGVYPHRYVHLRNPALRAWVRMLRLSQKVQPALAETLRGLGLNPAEFDILDTLAAREGLTQQELADALLVTKGNMTYHLCRMAERGLVDRRPEGRKNRLYLTGEGRRLLEEALPEHEALIDERFSGLSVEDRAQLADLLKKLDRSQP
jgi:MarR family transcriptional regulator, 2-MHQ and catechol-resistance regulon repressor